ncbi:MAG TPA: PKD domain-containing protein [Chitinophagales bacterium]|nr:PKD domain-containing protein [Chitinophagales bacterium]
MKKIFTILLSFSAYTLPAQNLLSNGDFETYTSLPYGGAQWSYCTGWSNCNGGGSPDYYHALGSGLVQLPNAHTATVSPHGGNAIMGFILWKEGFTFREYIAHALISPLTIGESYTVSFYLTTGIENGNYGGHGCDQMSVAFSTIPLIQNNWNPISFTPQYVMGSIFFDSTWQQFSFQFVADSAYDYVTFGNFAPDIATGLQFYYAEGYQCVYYFIDDIEVTAGGLVPPVADFISSQNNFCEQTCIDFTDQSANNPTVWEWTFPGGNPSSSTDQNPANICYSTQGNYDVTLIATNAAGNDTIVLHNFITVNAVPSVAITQSNDTLYSSIGDSYQWFTGGNSISGATNSFYVPLAAGAFIVLITNSNGCSASDTIDYMLAPFSNFSVIDQTICEKFCEDYFDESTNNPLSWQWIFDGGNPSASSQQDPTQVCYNTPGVYDVTLITTNAFGNDTLTLSGYITVYATPAIPAISQTGYTLTSTPAFAYQWQLNSVDIPGATNQSYMIMQTGFYSVVVSNQQGCVSSSTLLYVLISGVENVFGAGSFSIDPNPSSGIFMVKWLNGSMDAVTIEVSNAIGQRIFSSEEKKVNENFSKTIDLSGFASGIYFLEIKFEGKFFIDKIVIEK